MLPDIREIPVPQIKRIISGGQTGADRGALDAAIALGVEHGGFCPRGRRAEDGPIPARYTLAETQSSDYRVRTEMNVRISDATLILGRGALQGGSALTSRIARTRGRPCLYVDLGDDRPPPERVSEIRNWLVHHQVGTLNVAGSRASRVPGIELDTRDLLVAVLTDESGPETA